MTRTVIAATGALIAIVSTSLSISAHKPITSKYTYTQDVLPIFREKCGSCHRPGGAAPMSLLTYDEAYPWAESIRVELIAGHMPPAVADPTFGAIQHNRVLTAQETDVILTWATGGNPRGAEIPVIPRQPSDAWALGAPDAVVKLPETVTLPADTSEDTRQFVLTLKPRTRARLVRAVDVHPGTASVVRNVTISVKAPNAANGSSAADPILCRWVPGLEPVDASQEGGAFLLPADADVIVQIHYKKTWQYDGKPVSDDTTVGLYFANETTRPLEQVSLDAARPLPVGGDTRYTIDVPRRLEAFAVRVDQLPPDEQLEVEGLLPNGTIVPLLRSSGLATWEHRYWFAQPIALAQGSRIQVRVTYRDPALVADAFGGVNALASRAAGVVRAALDVIDRP